MDGSLAIQATNLSKKYRLGTIGMTSLREDLSRWWNRGNNEIAKNDSNQAGIEHSRMINDHEFWALHDLNFEIQRGEVIGLIGANGSGKSTLLKILSRITEPSEGEVRVRGKVASLLEVGTGFHPELTGRENIYINGAILGMTRKEVDQKFDEIVEFAGVENFIETPIKRYSSGMTVRLGFAVAAHLDPDILIVDEVLAVGDAAFQKKCLGKMEDISTQGRTIIFVSHQLKMIENLCTRSFLLEKGKISKNGNTKETIECYLSKIYSHDSGSLKLLDRKDRRGSGEIIVSSIKLIRHDKDQSNYICCGEGVKFLINFIKVKDLNHNNDIEFCLNIDNDSHQRLAILSSNAISCKIEVSKLLKNGLIIEIEKLPLLPGNYYLTVFLGSERYILDWISNAFTVSIIENDYFSTGKLPPKGHGDLLIDYNIKYH